MRGLPDLRAWTMLSLKPQPAGLERTCMHMLLPATRFSQFLQMVASDDDILRDRCGLLADLEALYG